MPQSIWVCRQGHQWFSPAGESSADSGLHCPKCGELAYPLGNDHTLDSAEFQKRTAPPVDSTIDNQPEPTPSPDATHNPEGQPAPHVDETLAAPAERKTEHDAVRQGETAAFQPPATAQLANSDETRAFEAASTPATKHVDAAHDVTMDRLPELAGTNPGFMNLTLDADAQAAGDKTRIPVDRTRPHSAADLKAGPGKKRRKDLAEAPKIPGYDILGVLGRGGMGVVYKARDLKLNRLVALKMILAGGHAGSIELARFQLEAEAVARVQHANIVQVFEVSEHAGLPYMALEFIEGGTLQDRMRGEPMTPRVAAELIETLARAMHFAHQRGIIHRDLKPANVLMKDEAGRVKEEAPKTKEEMRSFFIAHPSDFVAKITDFGLAKRLEEADHGQTGTGAILGTPTYMAPEQAQGKTKDVGPAADIYALGAMFYDLLTGRPPFKGETVLDTLQMVQANEPLPLRRLQPKVPYDLETICLKCLQKEPAKRFATAEDLATDLHRYLSGQPIKSRPTPVWERGWKWARRRPAVASLVGVSVMAAMALMFGGYFIAQREASRAANESHLKEIAISERVEADLQRDRATAQKLEANRQRDRADVNLQEAFSAADNLLSNVGDIRLAKTAGAEEVRRKLLTQASAFYEKIIRFEGNQTPKVRFQKGVALQRLGRIEELLGQHGQADQTFQKAIGELDVLAKNDPSESQYRVVLARTCAHRAAVLQALERRKETEAEYKRAIELFRTLEKEKPSPENRQLLIGAQASYATLIQNDRARRAEAMEVFRDTLEELGHLKIYVSANAIQGDRARVLSNLGILYLENDVKQAEPMLIEAKGLLEDLTKRAPDDPRYREMLGRVSINLGTLYDKAGDARKAVKSYFDSITQFQKLTTDAPLVIDYRHQLAVATTNLALLLETNKEFDKADDFRTKARAEWETLIKTAGDLPTYRQALARNLNDRARYLAGKNQYETAQKATRDALALQEKLVVDYPAVPEYRLDLAQGYVNLGLILHEFGVFEREEECYPRALKALEEARPSGADRLPRWLAIKIDAQQNHAAVYLDMKQPEKAAAAFESLLGDQEKQIDPKAPSAVQQRRLAGNYLMWLDTLVKIKAPARAQALAPRLSVVLKAAPVGAKGEEGRNEFRAACALAQCVAAVEDSDVPAGQRKELMTAYGDRALEFLRAAVARGFRDANALRDTAALAPIRERESFKTIEQSVAGGGR